MKLDLLRLWIPVIQQLTDHSEEFTEISGTALPQQHRQAIGKDLRDGCQLVKRLILIRRSSKDEQVAVVGLLLPELKLFKAITPVAPPPQQSYQHQSSLQGCCAQVMIELGWMTQMFE